MEQSAQARGGYHLQPVFATIARALGDDNYRCQHAALRKFRDSLLQRNVRQALFRADPATERRYLEDMRRFGNSGAGHIAWLAFLPEPMLPVGLLARKLFWKKP